MANPLFSLVLALLLFLLVFLVLKSLFRIVLFLVAVVVLYLGYVYFFQDEYPLPQIDPETMREWSEKVGEFIPKDFNLSGMDSNYTRPAPKD